MTLSFEALLVVGVIGFYIFDSAMLLHFNELVYVQKNNKWTFFCPKSHWHLLGKTLYIPHLLTVEFPIFRVNWSFSESNELQENQEELNRFLGALNALQYLTAALLLLLFGVLPSVLISLGTGLGLLVVFGVTYFTIIVMLVVSYRQRGELGLSGSAFAKLAFDSLACAPFALNLVRKITLRRSLSGDPIYFAKNTFDRATFTQLVSAICRRVDEELEIADDESTRFVALTAFRNRILSMA